MQKDGRIDPSACTLTLYSANGHVTDASLSIGHRGSQRDSKDGGPKTGPLWRTKSLNANEFLAMVANGPAREKIIRGDKTYWASGGANVWLVQI
jgi:hypothetical protein